MSLWERLLPRFLSLAVYKVIAGEMTKSDNCECKHRLRYCSKLYFLCMRMITESNKTVRSAKEVQSMRKIGVQNQNQVEDRGLTFGNGSLF